MKRKEVCPRCRENGGDSAGDNLHVYEDGHTHCFVCHFHESEKQYLKRQGGEPMQLNNFQNRARTGSQDSNKTFDLSFVSQLPHKALPQRGISKEVMEEYGVRCSVNEQTGEVQEVFYPLYNQNSEVCAYKIRILPKTFKVIGNFNDAKLFGQNLYEGKRRKLLIVTEGQDDCLAVRQIFKEAGKDYAVVSVHNAANNGKVDPNLLKHEKFFSEFETVVLCFDSDEVGQDYVKAVASWMCTFVKVGIMQVPEPCKDANDCLMLGMQLEFMKAFRSAQQYHPKEILRAGDFDFEKLITPKELGWALPWFGLQEYIKGIRKGELIIFASTAGGGKTAVAKELTLHLLNSYDDCRLGGVFLENSAEDIMRSFIALDNSIPTSRLLYNPNTLSREEWLASYEKFSDNDRIVLLNHELSINPDALADKVKYMVRGLGCNFVIIDNLLAAVAGSETDDERRSIDRFVEKLAKIAVENQVAIILVCHLKRVHGKSLAHGDEIEMSDLRGSSSIEGLAATIIGLERNMQHEEPEARNITKVRVIKNRVHGVTGLACKLHYSHETGRMKEVEEDF